MAALARVEHAEDSITHSGTKITRLIEAWEADHDEPFISFEYYAPRTETGVVNLVQRFGRMAKQKPLFMDVTWGAGGSTSDLTMDLCLKIKNDFQQEANMHLTCTNMDEQKVDDALDMAWKSGIVNILALRGDPPAGTTQWEAAKGGYNCARDLVAHIRKSYGDHFCVSVAAYPQGHPDRIKLVDRDLSDDEKTRATRNSKGTFVCSDEEYAIELQYLKAKIDAGAELVTTQMFFEATLYEKFVKDCRAVGITAPIIPGIMLLQGYSGFVRMIDMCKSHVPQVWLDRLEEVKGDEQLVIALGIEFGTQLCKDLTAVGAPGLHFYTLNMEPVSYGILKNLGYFKE